MNTKIVKALSLLFQLSDEDRAFVFRLWNMSEDERESLVVALQPEKVTTKKPTAERKIEHCEVCDYTRRAAVHKDSSLKDYHQFQSGKAAKKPATKSPRAQSLSGALSRTAKGRVQDDGDNEPQRQAITLCGASLASSGANCNLPEGHALHTDKGYVDYHPFRPAAPPARSRSSVNGGKGSTIPNSGTETEDVSNAHHAGG